MRQAVCLAGKLAFVASSHHLPSGVRGLLSFCSDVWVLGLMNFQLCLFFWFLPLYILSFWLRHFIQISELPPAPVMKLVLVWTLSLFLPVSGVPSFWVSNFVSLSGCSNFQPLVRKCFGPLSIFFQFLSFQISKSSALSIFLKFQVFRFPSLWLVYFSRYLMSLPPSQSELFCGTLSLFPDFWVPAFPPLSFGIRLCKLHLLSNVWIWRKGAKCHVKVTIYHGAILMPYSKRNSQWGTLDCLFIW